MIPRFVALAVLLILSTGCGRGDFFHLEAVTEVHHFASIEDMAAASDLMIEATVSSVTLSDYTGDLGGDPFHFADVRLQVVTVYGHREGRGTKVEPGSEVSVYMPIGLPKQMDGSLRDLRQALPEGRSWWFLHHVEHLGNSFYVPINSVSLISEEPGSRLIAGFYPASSEAARKGATPDNHPDLIKEIVATSPAELPAALVGSTQGDRDLGNTVPPGSRP
jgi:hypothetical protein